MTVEVLERAACCGCGVCGAVCPVQAIRLVPDELGFFYPHIEKSVCTDCGICGKRCPILHGHDDSQDYSAKTSYAGYYCDESKLLQSASGGAATALSEAIIAAGGVVFGVQWDPDFMPVWNVADTVEGLGPFKGSKYAESSRSEFYRKLATVVKEKSPILVIGLPCDIAAARSYLGLLANRENLYFCELLCNSVTSQKVLGQFISDLERVQGKKITDLSLRHKKDCIYGANTRMGKSVWRSWRRQIFKKVLALSKDQAAINVSLRGTIVLQI